MGEPLRREPPRVHRRTFFGLSLLALETRAKLAAAADKATLDLAAHERGRILKAAERCLEEQPITITATQSPRSAGGKHDFFSEGDYWWPDPKDPKAPYVQRDGMSNPELLHPQAGAVVSAPLPASISLAAAALRTLF